MWAIYGASSTYIYICANNFAASVVKRTANISEEKEKTQQLRKAKLLK